MSDKACNTKKTSIGGQALMEGVMMRGPFISSMAVRRPDGTLYEETWDTDTQHWYNKAPILRGVFNFVAMLLIGYRCLMKSAEISGIADEEEPSKFEKWMDAHLGGAGTTLFNIVVTIFSLLIAVGLFMLLPAALVKWVGGYLTLPTIGLSLIEGVLKIVIFVLYLYAVTRLSDIRRVFQYHGAEHKTIACYEAGMPLTPENAMKFPRFHPRCGTSFLLIVLVISIFVFSVLSWENLWMRVGLKLLLLPLVVGLSYEVIRFAGRHDNAFTRVLSAPGLWLQNLTTFEPDESQLAVAIAAMKPCIPDDQNADHF